MNILRDLSGQNLIQLISWANSVSVNDIPQPVLDKASSILADNLSVMIGARDEPEVAAFHKRVIARAQTREALIWRGGQHRTDLASAAVANALAGDWLELDEGYRITLCHAGLYLIPCLLAEAEANNLTYHDMLRVLVLGYEVVTRIARAWVVDEITMQSHGRYGAVGAATSVALARRLTSEQFVASLGAAATLIGPAPRNHLSEGVLIRNAWAASGAYNGLMAVEWVQCGIHGIPEALFDVYTTVLGGRAKPEALVQGLGAQWAMLDSYSKIYACCQHLHAAVEAGLQLRGAHPQLMASDQICRIEVKTHHLAAELANTEPATSLAAKFSLPHAMGEVFALGKKATSSFGSATLTDPEVCRLRSLVEITTWRDALVPPNDRPALVTVSIRSGETFSYECLSAEGGPDRPFPADMWVEKMRMLAQSAYPGIIDVFQKLATNQDAIREQLWRKILQHIVQP